MALKRETIFSRDRTQRFVLWRDWSEQLTANGAMTLHFTSDPHADYYPGKPDQFVQFIGLNPSLADEKTDDRTLTRCINFAKSWGFGAMVMTNLFPFITPYPKKLIQCSDADKVENRRLIYEIAGEAGMIICAYGNFVAAKFQSKIILDELKRQGRKLHHLGLNGDGTPKHPLYLKKDLQPILWS